LCETLRVRVRFRLHAGTLRETLRVRIRFECCAAERFGLHGGAALFTKPRPGGIFRPAVLTKHLLPPRRPHDRQKQYDSAFTTIIPADGAQINNKIPIAPKFSLDSK
jgi:hypothetical protein